MLAAAFFFSLMSVIVKVAGQRLPIAEIVFARSVVMLVIAYGLVRRAGVPLWGNRKPLLILRGLSGFAALFCFFYAITKLPLADITVLHFTNPAFTAILAMIFLKESMRPLEVLGLIVCLAGVILVTQPDFIFGENARSLNLFAVSVALAASLLSSIAYTTWAIRWAPRNTFVNLSRTTVRGSSSSRSPVTRSRRTSTRWGASTTASPPRSVRRVRPILQYVCLVRRENHRPAARGNRGGFQC